MIKVVTVPLQQDLTEFTRFLWQHEVPHRVIETEDTQELWVAHTVDAEQVYQLYLRWQEGLDLARVRVRLGRAGAAQLPTSRLLKRAWLSSALIGISLFLSLLIGFGDNFSLLKHFTFTDLQQQGSSLYTTGLAGTLSSLQWWRLLTPIFLHFSLMHILFNALWIWVAGTRVECQQGRLVLLGLVLVSGIASNLAQYWVSGPLFGGLSGVVFGLLGYAWLWDRIAVTPKIGLPPALMGFMLFWLALGFAGVLEGIGLGAIANTAHLVGLLAGLGYAVLVKGFRRA